MTEPFYRSDSGNFIIYKEDTMKLLCGLERKFSMIFADPPYFLSKGFTMRKGDKVKCFDKGEWDKQRSLDDIDAYNMNWLSMCRGLLVEDGCIWVTGTYHNIYSVANCMMRLGYKILNIIVWQKPNAPLTLSDCHFNFSAEYIIWARKSKEKKHYFNIDITTELSGGKRMSDVWSIPTVETWEKHYGKHPTQKPLKLLFRAIISNTHEGDWILDPFAGSCTTGIAANLLKRNFVGIDFDEKYLEIGINRRKEINNLDIAASMLAKMSVSDEEPMVMVNHAKPETRNLMIEKGICYLRAGDSKGSLLVKPGFERLQYLLLHTNGNDSRMFKLKNKGHFQIWMKETLEEYGFKPSHAPYYIVLLFDKTKTIEIKNKVGLRAKSYTYVAKIKPLSEFII